MPILKTWIALEKCAFCGLGFSPMWVAQFASCRHVYHDRCIVYHFGTSTNCIQQGCEEEMHEHGGFLQVYKSQIFQLMLKMEALQKHNLDNVVTKVQCLIFLIQ